MADVALAAAAGTSTVLLSAAMGKLSTTRGMSRSAALAVLEVFLGLAIALLWSQPLVAALGLVTATAFAVHAWALPADRPCACFGERLPTTSRAGQRYRNTSFAFLAALLVLNAFVAHGSVTFLPGLDATIGVATGIVLVGGPWLVGWIRPAQPTQPARYSGD